MEITSETTDKGEFARKIIERKVKLVENPASIILAPKTREGHIMVKILFGSDKAMGAIRLKAGTYIPVQDVTASLKKAEEFISHLQGVLTLLGSDGSGLTGYTSPELKVELAKRRTSYVFIPRTTEAQKIAQLIKGFDGALLAFRNTCTDFTKAKKVIDAVVGVISEFHNLTEELSGIAKINYKTPKGLDGMLNRKKESTSSSQKPGA